MGWQDAPVITGNGWQSAPTVGGDVPKQPVEQPDDYIDNSPSSFAATALQGLMKYGPMGAVMALGSKGVENIPKVGKKIGNTIVDAGTQMGFSPNVNAALATAGDLGFQTAITSPMVMRGVGKVPEVVQGAARRLMTSALKPSDTAHLSGDASRAVQTLLDQGVNVTPSGVDKLNAMLAKTNQQIADAVAGSNAVIDKPSVASRLQQLLPRMQQQVNPQGDIAAVQSAAQKFMEHPLLPTDDIPVALAQKMKQGTYSQLSGKYGEEGSAAIEAQKTLARGLKEEIAKAIPEIADLNKRDSELYNALSLTERRVLMNANNNPMGLAPLASNPKAALAFMADRSPAFKSILARMLNAISTPIKAP